MKPIKIKETPNGDTRANGGNLDADLVLQDTYAHIDAVADGLIFLAEKMKHNAKMHDYTKLEPHFKDFFEVLNSGKKDEEFYESEWWKLHSTSERHHLNSHVPEDVNLLDVIEMVVDMTMAGLARTGEVYPIKISSDILEKAIQNTSKLIIENTEVEKVELEHSDILNLNRDFYEELRSFAIERLEIIKDNHSHEPWFEEAWNEYRKDVLKDPMGHMRMPGSVFNKYINKEKKDENSGN